VVGGAKLTGRALRACSQRRTAATSSRAPRTHLKHCIGISHLSRGPTRACTVSTPT
jgi:hypothetical protein